MLFVGMISKSAPPSAFVSESNRPNFQLERFSGWEDAERHAAGRT